VRLPYPIAFAREAARWSRRNRSTDQAAIEMWKLYPRWRRALRKGANPLADQKPWMTFAASAWLDSHLQAGMRVFEWGVGGSTLLLIQRGADLVSVEHDESWAERTREEIGARKLASEWTPKVVEPEPNRSSSVDASDPDLYRSTDQRYCGYTFRAYASAIDAYPDESFDLVIVDGRARPSCVAHGQQKVKPGGWLLLDDAERPHYQRAANRLARERWMRRDYPGPGPYKGDFWLTSGWRRPAPAAA
jgi:hypothetical protein